MREYREICKAILHWDEMTYSKSGFWSSTPSLIISTRLNARFARVVLHATLRKSHQQGKRIAYLAHISTTTVTPRAVVLDQI